MFIDLSAMNADPVFGMVSDKLPNGVRSWTLTSLLGVFLDDAEKKYGERDKSWTILGVQITDDGPMTWFPSSIKKQIIINLNRNSATNIEHLIFELAQEIVHLLDPVKGGKATAFEEGLATLFARGTIAGCGLQGYAFTESYTNAERDLLALGDDTDAIVRKLRTNPSSLANLTAATLTAAVPNCDPALADRLCMKFA